MSWRLWQSKPPKMPLECLSFCLIIWTVSWAQKIIVSQPNSAQGIEGETVTLKCSYNFSSKPKIGSYFWVKDSELEVKNTTLQFKGRINRTSDEGFLQGRRADIEIQNLRYYDAGMYRCVVSFHELPESSGNGTQLHVRKPNVPKKDMNSIDPVVLIWLAAGLGSALVVSITIPLIFVCLRKKQVCRAKPSKTKDHSQDHQAEAELNYAELTVKKGKALRLQSERVTYAAVKRHEQQC